MYYQDESWVFKNIECTKICKGCIKYSTHVVYNVLFRKGERSIISQIRCAENGLLNNCLLLFRDSKINKNPDYLTEMN